MHFKDRTDAGQKLALQLHKYSQMANGIVIGLPRGGVPVAYEVAQALKLSLDIVCPRKIGAPGNPEFALGAVTESGEGIIDADLVQMLGVDADYLQAEIESERKEAQHRLEYYRKGLPPRILRGKTVIIIDDGLATGATMKAALASIRKESPEKVVVAVPVSPSETLEEMKELADEVVCLEIPLFFQAVGQFYEDFGQTTDKEVICLLQEYV